MADPCRGQAGREDVDLLEPVDKAVRKLTVVTAQMGANVREDGR